MQNTLDVTRQEVREGIAGTRTAIWRVVERLRVKQMDASSGDLGEGEEQDEIEERYNEEWKRVKRRLRDLGFGMREVRRSKMVLISYLREKALLITGTSGNRRRSRSQRSNGSLRSRGRRRARTRARRYAPHRSWTADSVHLIDHIGSASLPRSAPPPYSRGSQWSTSSRSIVASPSRSSPLHNAQRSRR